MRGDLSRSSGHGAHRAHEWAELAERPRVLVQLGDLHALPPQDGVDHRLVREEEEEEEQQRVVKDGVDMVDECDTEQKAAEERCEIIQRVDRTCFTLPPSGYLVLHPAVRR